MSKLRQSMEGLGELNRGLQHRLSSAGEGSDFGSSDGGKATEFKLLDPIPPRWGMQQHFVHIGSAGWPVGPPPLPAALTGSGNASRSVSRGSNVGPSQRAAFSGPDYYAAAGELIAAAAAAAGSAATPAARDRLPNLYPTARASLTGASTLLPPIAYVPSPARQPPPPPL